MKSSGEFYEEAYECFDTVFASMVITNQPYGMSFDDANLNVAGEPKEYTQGFPVGDDLSGEIDYDYHVGDNGWCTFYYTDNTTGEVTPLNKGTYTISLYNSFTGDLLATGSYTIE